MTSSDLCFIKDENANTQWPFASGCNFVVTKFNVHFALMSNVMLMDTWAICIFTDNSLQFFAAR